MHLCKEQRSFFLLISYVLFSFSVLQPEQTLPEKYQLARAVLQWYCSSKMVND